VKTRIYYDDTDAGGIVYHVNYLKYCERARSEYFFSRGIAPFEDAKSGFVVRKAECDFLGRARLGDMIEIKSYKVASKRVSLELVQEIYKEETCIFRARLWLAYIREGKPARIPERFAEIFDSLPLYES